MAITVGCVNHKYKGLVMMTRIPQTTYITGPPSLFLPQRREVDSETDGNVLTAVMLSLPISLLLWALMIRGVESLMH